MSHRHGPIGTSIALVIAAAVILAATPASTQPADEPAPPAAPEGPINPGQVEDVQPYGGSFWQRGALLGDPGGLRSALAARGITLGLQEQAEILGNVSGGVRRGAALQGLLTMTLGVDTEKAGLWPGGRVNVSAFQIHGRSLSFNNLSNTTMTTSSIEAARGTLLFELWYEQALLNEKLNIRVGQLAADQEFMLTEYGGLFINSTFGWPALPSSNLPSGGPAYPLATPGVRVRYAPRDDFAMQLGVFNGDPSGRGVNDPQERNPSGTAFRLRDGVFAIGEVQYAINQGDDASGLPGTYKLGAWYNSQPFQDQRRTEFGVSLADAANLPEGAVGRSRRGNWSIYAVADQLVWRQPGTKDQGIGVFARVMGGPGDRNLYNFYADAGVTWKGVIPGRPDDTAGLGFGIARISDTVSQLDSDVRAQDPAYPIRRHDSVLELTYQAQITRWWQVQPTFQYLFNLNGGIPNPERPERRLGDAAVFGIRTGITF